MSKPATASIIALLLLPGCAAAIPAVSAISAGAAAGEKGYSFWKSGRLYYVDEGSLDDMTTAVEAMIDRLALTIRDHEREEPGSANPKRKWTLRTDRAHLLRLEIEPLTESLVAVELDVGSFGNDAAAQLIAQRIKEELDAVQSEPAP